MADNDLILDENGGLDPKSVKVAPTASRYGLYGGLILIALGLIFYLANLNTEQWVQWVSYIPMLGAIYLAIQYHRDNELGGRMSFGRGLGMGTLTALIMGLIIAVWTFVFMSFIVPDNYVSDVLMEQVREQWEAQGLEEEQMEMAEEMTMKFMSPPVMSLMAVFGTVLVGFVGSLIFSGILQKK